MTSLPWRAWPAGLVNVRVEDEGIVSVISFYVYGLIGLSLLVVVSPLIIFAIPLLVFVGPVGLAWWRGRRASPRVGAAARGWLVVVSLVVLAMPFVPAMWFLIASETDAPPESFWLIVIGIAVCPLALAATTDAIRWNRTTDPGSPARN